MQPLSITSQFAVTEESDSIADSLNDLAPLQKSKSKADHITPREKEIIQLMAEGFSTKEVAEHLRISFHTVESYRKNLLHKMGAKNTVHLIAMAGKMFFY